MCVKGAAQVYHTPSFLPTGLGAEEKVRKQKKKGRGCGRGQDVPSLAHAVPEVTQPPPSFLPSFLLSGGLER